MFVVWMRQRVTHNAGIVDVAWSANLGLLAAFYALCAGGITWRLLLVGALAAGWSVRLATFLLFNRILGKPEDSRYADLREEKGEDIDKVLLPFFQVQAVLDVILSLSFLAAMKATNEAFTLFDGLAIVLWCVSVGGEMLSDKQLADWRANAENRGKTCKAGLWRYSRHPNYFFEWLHWLVYPLLAVSSPWFAVTFASPVIMLFFILKFTGIPPTEARARKTRPDYAEYQRTTSAFVPWFPKGNAS